VVKGDYTDEVHLGLKVRYLHRDITDNAERAECIRGLQAGKYDILVGLKEDKKFTDTREIFAAYFDRYYRGVWNGKVEDSDP
jgi:excinuclease UvrABC helicase subunit UvrB